MPNNHSPPHPIPASLFDSPRLSVGFSPKAPSADSETSLQSPTSTLETKHFSLSPPSPIGLGQILHSDTKTNSDDDSRSFLVGSQLKIQTLIEFGIKTKDSQLALHAARGQTAISSFSPELLTGMERSEEYTCVISHGPNPKVTHIFDNCIVEGCGAHGSIALREERNGASMDGFLSLCHSCNNNLPLGKDIFMYRGEKAFCSKECRRREMMLEEGEAEFSQHLSELL